MLGNLFNGASRGAGVGTGLAAGLNMIDKLIEIDARKKQGQQEVEMNSNYIDCPNCGIENLANQDSCEACGAELVVDNVYRDIPTRTCSSCGVETDASKKFCGDCGFDSTKARICYHCHNPIKEGKQFCMLCGKKFEEGLAPVKCSNCGEFLAQGKKFCRNCGTNSDKD